MANTEDAVKDDQPGDARGLSNLRSPHFDIQRREACDRWPSGDTLSPIFAEG